MLLACAPLHGDDEALPVQVFQGPQIATLWRQRIRWSCADGLELSALFLALQPMVVPDPSPDEPLVSALARLAHAAAQQQALFAWLNPGLLRGRMALACGIRLFGVTDDDAFAAWDETLSLGQPVYGLRGTMVCSAVRPDATAMLSALAYGGARCEDGLHLTTCDEQRNGVTLAADHDLTISVIVRDGFEAATHHGASLSWRDAGNEGYVRLVARSAHGICLLQPRFVAPASPGTCHHD